PTLLLFTAPSTPSPSPLSLHDALPISIPFPEDREHASYDADAARRCFLVLAQADRLLKEFRGSFLGKCSPVHFFWGSFDLACTRDRKSTRLNSSHVAISYAVFCLKKKK